MRIGAYIVKRNAKQTYKVECFNIRQNAGIAIVIDILRRSGYEVEWCSSANVHNFDVVLFAMTADCDWWEFIAERVKWQKGNYKVVVGGAGCLNVRPFLEHVDYFVLGRAEGVIDKLIKGLETDGDYEGPSVINSKTFNVDKSYMINQAGLYPHVLKLENGKEYKEDVIGCNHKCLFCGYTWHRKCAQHGAFRYKFGGLWDSRGDIERAILDMDIDSTDDLTTLRTTAIDGMSERLRYMVNKKISRDMLTRFIVRLAGCKKPHQTKFFNIVGYPTETDDDWRELLDTIKDADAQTERREKQTCILLHNTPFRAMPATPMACAPMSYKNYRGKIAKMGRNLKGNVFYQGKGIWAVESMGTDSLPTVIKSAIVWRGIESDADNFVKLALSKKFDGASTLQKQVTLEKYFDVARLFGKYTLDDLPTRYLATYADYKKALKVIEKW